jgi:hypothetical protein
LEKLQKRLDTIASVEAEAVAILALLAATPLKSFLKGEGYVHQRRESQRH